MMMSSVQRNLQSKLKRQRWRPKLPTIIITTTNNPEYIAQISAKNEGEESEPILYHYQSKSNNENASI